MTVDYAQWLESSDATHFSGTVLTYGMVFLSTNEPKPSRKFCVMFFILLAVDTTIALTMTNDSINSAAYDQTEL